MGETHGSPPSRVTPVLYKIPGKPVPLARPRFTKNKVYDPQEQIKEEYAWQILHQRKPPYPLTGPLELNITFYMQIPKSTSKKNKLALNGTPHPIKPDLDNLIKFIMDVASGILYKDDKTITEITARKLYDTNPRTIFTLRQL